MLRRSIIQNIQLICKGEYVIIKHNVKITATSIYVSLFWLSIYTYLSPLNISEPLKTSQHLLQLMPTQNRHRCLQKVQTALLNLQLVAPSHSHLRPKSKNLALLCRRLLCSKRKVTGMAQSRLRCVEIVETMWFTDNIDKICLTIHKLNCTNKSLNFAN